MHQKVAHGADGGGGNNVLHLRRFRGGGHRGLRLHRFGRRTGGKLHRIALCRRDIRFFVHKVNAQIDQKRGGGRHQHDEHR